MAMVPVFRNRVVFSMAILMKGGPARDRRAGEGGEGVPGRGERHAGLFRKPSVPPGGLTGEIRDCCRDHTTKVLSNLVLGVVNILLGRTQVWL